MLQRRFKVLVAPGKMRHPNECPEMRRLQEIYDGGMRTTQSRSQKGVYNEINEIPTKLLTSYD